MGEKNARIKKRKRKLKCDIPDIPIIPDLPINNVDKKRKRTLKSNNKKNNPMQLETEYLAFRHHFGTKTYEWV